MLYIPSEYLHAVTIYVIFEKQSPCPRHDTRAGFHERTHRLPGFNIFQCFEVLSGFQRLPGLRNPWKLICSITDACCFSCHQSLWFTFEWKFQNYHPKSGILFRTSYWLRQCKGILITYQQLIYQHFLAVQQCFFLHWLFFCCLQQWTLLPHTLRYIISMDSYFDKKLHQVDLTLYAQNNRIFVNGSKMQMSSN